MKRVMKQQIEPGATIGVLGSGQLGRMFAMAARRLGYRVHVYSPDNDTPTGQLADVEVEAAYDDLDAVARFAQRVDAITFEFENVPAATIDVAARYVPVRPGQHVLHTTQQRLREKTFLRQSGFPVTEFRTIGDVHELSQAAVELGRGVLKTAAWGYDGRGQVMVPAAADAPAAWSQLDTELAVFEQFVDFASEFSVVGVRGQDGQFVHYGPIANTHERHILDLSVAPAGLPAQLSLEAVEVTRQILEKLDVVGVLCVEFFLTRDGRILVNELAPRPHNSGHLTIDAHETCQFEQQLRAVCGLPLGGVRQKSPAAMVNILGDCWANGEPAWSRAISLPGVNLHLYGKREARPGRKMGHLTALGASRQEAVAKALQARQLMLQVPTPHVASEAAVPLGC